MKLNLPMVAQTLDYTCGAACFESMYQFLKMASLGEMHFARELGALDLGYTPPRNIEKLARQYGFICEFKEQAQIIDLRDSLMKGRVIFVTWWDEDAGHYSLVKDLDDNMISLMDPWKAREGLDNRLSIGEFVSNWQKRGALMIAVAAAG